MRCWIPSLLMLLLVSGCIVVRSDAARLDDETGAFHVDLRSGGENTEKAPEDTTEAGDDSKIAQMREKREKIGELERKIEKAETKMEIAEMESDLAEEARDHQSEEAQRSLREAEQDLELYHGFERLELIHRAKQGLASAESRFLDAKAELEQLTILYEGSELEDGTDELVLERDCVHPRNPPPSFPFTVPRRSGTATGRRILGVEAGHYGVRATCDGGG